MDLPQGVAEELQPARSAAGFQSRVQNEAGQHIRIAGGGVQQGGQVTQAKVAA